jgi:hypothetical protein
MDDKSFFQIDVVLIFHHGFLQGDLLIISTTTFFFHNNMNLMNNILDIVLNNNVLDH